MKVFLRNIINTTLQAKAVSTMSSFFERLDVDSLVNKVIGDLAPSITWNHDKVLAVNGTTLMTGGINFWDQFLGSICGQWKTQHPRSCC